MIGPAIPRHYSNGFASVGDADAVAESGVALISRHARRTRSPVLAREPPLGQKTFGTPESGKESTEIEPDVNSRLFGPHHPVASIRGHRSAGQDELSARKFSLAEPTGDELEAVPRHAVTRSGRAERGSARPMFGAGRGQAKGRQSDHRHPVVHRGRA